jgi:hypothetical protein
VLWLDSDTFICHPEIPLEYILEKSGSASILIGKDHPWTSETAYCAGVFLIKNDKIGKKFIEDCINYYIASPCDGQLKGEYAGECYEQGVMNIFLKKEYSNNLYNIPVAFTTNTHESLFTTVILHLYVRDKENGYNGVKKYFNNHIEMIPNYKAFRPAKIALLITMYTNSEREHVYMNNLQKWIKDGFDVFSVDSSGKNYDVKGLNHYSFIQENNTLENGPSIKERDSIIKAVTYFSHRLKNYDYIFKITGKYYLPNFKDMSSYIPIKGDLILQNNTESSGQNSEVVGFKPSLIMEIVQKINLSHRFEIVLDSISRKKLYRIYRLLPLKIDRKIKRTDGYMLDYI